MTAEESYLITEEACRDLLQKIVDKHLPAESMVFALKGDDLVKEMYHQQWTGHQEGHGDKHAFADLATAKLVLEIVSVAFGTIKVISELRALRNKEKKLDLDKVQSQWERRLRDEGIKSKRAREIASSFSKEIISLSQEM